MKLKICLMVFLCLCILSFSRADTLGRQLYILGGKLEGFETDTKKLEQEYLDLLNQYDDPKDIGRIYAALTDMYGQSGILRDPFSAAKYAQKALEYPLDPPIRILVYHRWGGALQAQIFGASGSELAKGRREAVRPYLYGIKVALEHEIPDEKVGLPPTGGRVRHSGRRDPEIYEQLVKEREEQVAARQKAKFINDMVFRRDRSIHQVVSLYSKKPFAADELRQTATEILEDTDAVEKLISKVDAAVKKRLQKELGEISEEILQVDPVIIKHRERIQPVINNLRNESFDDLLRNLNLDEGYIRPVHLTYKKFPQIDIEVVYSSRRVLRLLSLLQDMPRAEAAEKCKAIFESAFSVYKDTAEAGLRMWEDPDAPKHGRSKLGNKWALSASLILSSRFCDAETVLARIEAVDKYNGDLTRRVENSPNLLPGRGLCLAALRSFHYLQPRLKFQALADAIIADNSIDDPEIVEYLGKIPTKKILLTAWDAEITSFEFPHRHEGVPIDRSKGVTPLILYYEDINLADFYFIRDKAKEILK